MAIEPLVDLPSSRRLVTCGLLRNTSFSASEDGEVLISVNDTGVGLAPTCRVLEFCLFGWMLARGRTASHGRSRLFNKGSGWSSIPSPGDYGGCSPC
jgi:hypothetical protein